MRTELLLATECETEFELLTQEDIFSNRIRAIMTSNTKKTRRAITEKINGKDFEYNYDNEEQDLTE